MKSSDHIAVLHLDLISIILLFENTGRKYIGFDIYQKKRIRFIGPGSKIDIVSDLKMFKIGSGSDRQNPKKS